MLSFNQFEYLPLAMASVLREQAVPVQLIVIDPGSTDGSREYVLAAAQSDPRIDPLFEADDGPADGLRKGLALASMPIIGCLNSDDEYLTGALVGVSKQFALHASVAVIFGDGFIRRGTADRFFRSDDFRWFWARRGLFTVLHQATFYSKAALDSLNVNFNPNNRTCWDAEILADVALAGGRLLHLPECWAVFRIHDSSITGSGRTQTLYEQEHADVLAKYRTDGFRQMPILEPLLVVGARVLRKVRQGYLAARREVLHP